MNKFSVLALLFATLCGTLCVIGVYETSHASSPAQHARRLQQQARNTAQTTNPHIVPGFQTDSPAETNFNDHKALEAASERAFETKADAAFLKHTAETRPYFKLDVEVDPLVVGSRASIETPEAVLGGERTLVEGEEFETTACFESKPPKEFTCSKNLLPPQFHVEPAKYSHHWCRVGKHRPDDPACRAKVYYNPARMYEEEKIHAQAEAWSSTCGELEAKVQRGICRLLKRECPKGPETREVVGTMGGQAVTRKITRPCWRYELTYACAHPSANTCEPLRKQGCSQIGSACLTKTGDMCVEWQQTFKCPTRRGESRKVHSPAYGLGPQQASETEPPNGAEGALAEAISKLSVLKEIQDDLRASGNAVALPQIFKGKDCRCTIAFANFKNCCTDGRGWGVSLGISGCGAEEKDLAEREQKGLCHEIGTYCAEKLLGVCIRKKRSFCCFPSKLSRILHEQGRAQVGISWGEPESPDCRGFTEQEIARINFDQLDLSEVFAEVAASVRQKTVGVVQRNLSDRVTQMTRGLKNKPAEAGV